MRQTLFHIKAFVYIANDQLILLDIVNSTHARYWSKKANKLYRKGFGSAEQDIVSVFPISTWVAQHFADAPGSD